MAVSLMIAVNAFSVTFKASAPRSVVVGEPFQLSYLLNDRGGQNLNKPEVSPFEVIAGPYTSTSSSVQIVNGTATSSSSERYTYTLVARKTGTFTLPVATITCNGERLSSNALKINVLPAGDNSGNSNSNAGQHNSNAAPQSASAASGRGEAQLNGENVFVRAIPSKTKLYEQDCLLITYKLYSLVDVLRSQGAKVPDFNGFMKQEMPQDKNPQMQLEHYNGKNYMTVTLYQALLYPQHSGRLTISPFSFDLVFRLHNRSNDFFSSFFDSYKDVQKTISSGSVAINVEPLPGNKPANFSGGVGSFDFKSSISSSNVSVNDPITLKYTISGTGNLKLVKNPEVEFPADFETYDPKVNNNFKTSQGGVSGSKTVEFLLIPRSAGDFKIPSYEFSYFDVKSHSYKTIRTQEYSIHVSKGAGGNGVAMANYSNQEQLKMLGQDIRYVHTKEPDYEVVGDYLLGSVRYWIAILLSLAGACAAFFVLRNYFKINSDETLRKNRKANKVATKRLKTANGFMASGDKEQFYNEVLRAMLGYVCDKFSIPQSELTKENIGEKLEANSVNQEDVADFLDVLDTCEFARYSPSAGAEMAGVYEKAIDVISRIQQNVK
ncbi:MAG: protein BatD [Paludibacteraceae bacterium]|nr:protein BatD [Paludibacteraceae bacterium]MBP5137207.1 protein BatD [Paludibacteraceae bacterium]